MGGDFGAISGSRHGCVSLSKTVCVSSLFFSPGRCVVSGSGNVAQYCIEKLLEFGAIPLTASGGGEGGEGGGREVRMCVCGCKRG